MPCPSPLKDFTPRTLQSPSALRQDSDCRAAWGRAYLEGRRLPDIPFAELPPPPAKAMAGATKALKAYNKRMRPALGTAVHAILEAYYKQNVRGAWHPPMAWVELAPLWYTRPGQIALSGRGHMPDPQSLVSVACEELVTVAPPPGWEEAWPALGGTPDLVTASVELAQIFGQGEDPRVVSRVWWHLYDYKTTLSFGYAKTAEELIADEQANIYGLAVMQAHGLESLDCTWIYMRTEGANASRAVHFTLTRAGAEARVAELAAQALELAALTSEYTSAPAGFLGADKRLAVLQSLPTNDGACDNYGGCPFHVSEGGPCKPKKSPLGDAMARQAREKQKITGRKQAARKQRDIMALTAEQQAEKAELEAVSAPNFAQKQKLLKLKKLEAEGGEATPPAPPVDTTGESAPPPAAPEPAKPAAAPKAKPAAPGAVQAQADFAEVRANGTTVSIPKTSPLYKAILKVVKAHEAFEAALAGDL